MSISTYCRRSNFWNEDPEGVCGIREMRPLTWQPAAPHAVIPAAQRVESAVMLRRIQRGETLPVTRVRHAPQIGPGCRLLHALAVKPSDPRSAGAPENTEIPCSAWSIAYRPDADAVVILGTYGRGGGFFRPCDADACTSALARYDRGQRSSWICGEAWEYIGASPGGVRFIELRTSLSVIARELRQARDLTQKGLADLIGSSQSRIAKLEAGDGSVSFELIMRALVFLGMSNAAIAEAIAQAPQAMVARRRYVRGGNGRRLAATELADLRRRRRQAGSDPYARWGR